MMGSDICLLITIYYAETQSLLRCALKVDRDRLTEDCRKYPLEPENRGFLHSLLPLHVRSCGPIVDVDVDYLFEIVGA